MARALKAWASAVVLLLLTSGGAHAESPSPVAGEAGIDEALRAAIELNFRGDWDAAEAAFAAIRTRAPEHPGGYGFGATALLWRIDVDPADPRYDEDLVALLERSVELAQRRSKREPEDPRWHYYRGQGLGYLSRLDAQRGRLYGAGRKGEQARVHHERALELAPDFGEPKASLGPYLYFAEFIPGALKWLSFLWFVPEGDAERGLALLEEAARESRINALGARYGLLRLYGRYEENRWEEALTIATDFRERFPDNAIIHLEMLRLLSRRSEHLEAALALSREIETKAEAGVPSYGARAAIAARIWRARSLMRSSELEAAHATLDALTEAEIAKLYRGRAWTELTRGQLRDAAGERERAEEHYEEVVALEDLERDLHARKLAELYLERPYRP